MRRGDFWGRAVGQTQEAVIATILPHHPLQHRGGELTAGDLRLAQLTFEGGAAGEEFVHFGDDAFLFGEGWERIEKFFN